MWPRSISFVVILLVCVYLPVFSLPPQANAESEGGYPFIRNYTFKDYDASSQIWSVVQDSRGVIYFGASGGEILEYDGVEWRYIRLPDVNDVVRSMDIDQNGTIYVGSEGELGYLEPDPRGNMQYVSLVDKVPPEDRDFNDVWQTIVTDEGVYFYAYMKLLRWDGREFKVWRLDTMGGIHIHDGSFYTCGKNGDFLEFKNDSLKVLTNRADFKKGIRAIFPLDPPNTDVLINRWQGPLQVFSLENYDYTDSYKVPEELNRYLVKNVFYEFCPLPDGGYAIGTLNGGVVITDRHLNIRQVLNKKAGLQDDAVLRPYCDRRGGLWLALNNGISRAEIDSPFSFFGDRTGIHGSVLGILRHKGRLYAGSQEGLFILENGRFEKIEGFENECWHLETIDGELFAGGIDGIFRVEGDRATLIQDVLNVFHLHQSRIDPSRMYVAHETGFLVMQRDKNKKWRVVYREKSLAKEVRLITEDSGGYVWLSLPEGGIARLQLDNRAQVTEVKRFDTSHGLPGINNNYLISYNNRLVAQTLKGFYLYEKANERFVPAPYLNNEFEVGEHWITGFTETSEGNVWVSTRYKKKSRLKLATKQYSSEKGKQVFQFLDAPFWRLPVGEVNFIYPEEGGITWFGVPNGIYRYDGKKVRSYGVSYNTLIRKVVSGQDNVIFNGTYYKTINGRRSACEEQPESLKPELEYKENHMTFRFAALSFDDLESNRYSYYLEGHDKRWSDWTPQTYISYSGIWEGAYTFKVKSRNIYGAEGRESSFEFTILPPWYRTLWAILGYVLAVFFVFYTGVRLYSSRLKKANLRLEGVVEDRTSEILRQKDELESQAGELRVANEVARKERETAELANRSKSDFLARMSHEIRTPLNGVMGFIELLLDTGLSGEQLDYARTIQRSGDALVSVVNDILDFSKIEAGELVLEVIDFDPEMTAYDVCDIVMPRVDVKPVELLCRIGENVPSFVSGDAGRFRQVLINLVGNAAKFTEEGEVELSLEVSEEKDERIKLHVKVRDTGIGIEKDKLDAIFNVFSQADGSTTRKYGGTGLGLAICKEIARAMGGDAWAQSEPGKGSVFHFTAWMKKSRRQAMMPVEKEDLEGKKVLVVDNNSTNLDILTHVLQSAGMRVIRLTKGEEVITVLKENLQQGDPFDIAVLDIRMGAVRGETVAKQVRQLETPLKELPLLAFSSSARSKTRDCKEAGFDGYLPKPIRRRRMLQMMEHLLLGRADAAEAGEEPLLTRHALLEEAKHSIRILLVEDNAVSRKLAYRMLTKAGYKVTSALNGEEGVEIFLADPEAFDLIFMDIQMPRMDGRQATRTIREKGYKDIPIIAMTAEGLKGDREKCLEAGMNDYISKPVNREIAFRMIRKWTKVF